MERKPTKKEIKRLSKLKQKQFDNRELIKK